MNAAQGLADRGRRAKELYDRYLGDFEIWFAEEYYHTLQREEVRRSASSACHGRSVWRLMEAAWRGARLASIRGIRTVICGGRDAVVRRIWALVKPYFISLS